MTDQSMHLIPLSDIDFGPEEEEAVLRVLRSRWLSMGEETQAFEREFAAYLGVKHAIALANGTAALHLALLALGLGPGDVVIQPAVNFVAAANMTVAVGASPLFADIRSLTEPTISPSSILDLLTNNGERKTPRPRALVIMHYGGYPCRMDEILAICQEHNLALIEDACHAVGARYSLSDERSSFIGSCKTTSTDPTHNEERITNNGQPAAPPFPHLACFSFFANKNLVTGEGGMVTTNNDELAARVRSLRSHGMTSLTWDRHKGHAATYDVVGHGFNYRIDELRSAIGRTQLERLDRNNARRRRLTALYWEKLAPLEKLGWLLPFKDLYNSSLVTCDSSGFSCRSSLVSCHLMPIVAPDAETRLACANALKAVGIQTSLHYPFVPSFSAFSGKIEESNLGTSREFSSRVMTLPLYPTLQESDVSSVAAALSRETSRTSERFGSHA